MTTLKVLLFGLAMAIPWALPAAERTSVRALKITILSTMLADGDELGEWGFAALVEADGKKILFDTGAKTDVVQKNLQTLKLSLADVTDVVLSHWHGDHVGGFMTLRREAMAKNPAALGRTHVAAGFFDSRVGVPPGVELNRMIAVRPEYEATGGKFLVHTAPVALQPGVWLTGPVPRKHPERNWSGSTRVRTAAGEREDTVADDLALVVDTAQGLVVVTGCGHAGVINIIEHARSVVRPARVQALIGGIHLFRASEETLAWTTGRLREFGVDHFIGAHCTGIETVWRFRADLGLDRARCVVGAVGQTFELGKGIDARAIAK
ncbi:MAG: MBL fold metallo-hydrolase [Opitutaceae bacterium]|nr:MBL fold metallo-hydrolase [Opitutaceae bacterium]